MKELIGVTTYKRLDMLESCVESIRKSTDLTDSVLVIHNNSVDAAYGRAVEAIARARGAEVMCDGVNHGLAAAWNRLARRSGSERIVLMNDDIKVYPGWQSAVRATLSDPRMGVISLSLANGHASWDHRNPDLDGASLPLARYYCTYPTGCFLAMRREAYDRVGPFDESLWLRLEEVDYGIRAIRAGYRNANIGADQEVYKFAAHYGSASGGSAYGVEDMSEAQVAIAKRTDQHFEEKHGVKFPLPQEYERQLRDLMGVP